MKVLAQSEKLKIGAQWTYLNQEYWSPLKFISALEKQELLAESKARKRRQSNQNLTKPLKTREHVVFKWAYKSYA